MNEKLGLYCNREFMDKSLKSVEKMKVLNPLGRPKYLYNFKKVP